MARKFQTMHVTKINKDGTQTKTKLIIPAKGENSEESPIAGWATVDLPGTVIKTDGTKTNEVFKKKSIDR